MDQVRAVCDGGSENALSEEPARHVLKFQEIRISSGRVQSCVGPSYHALFSGAQSVVTSGLLIRVRLRRIRGMFDGRWRSTSEQFVSRPKVCNTCCMHACMHACMHTFIPVGREQLTIRHARHRKRRSESIRMPGECSEIIATGRSDGLETSGL